jgi:hypothetical protein
MALTLLVFSGETSSKGEHDVVTKRSGQFLEVILFSLRERGLAGSNLDGQNYEPLRSRILQRRRS